VLAQHTKYSKVSIPLDDITLPELAELGITIENAIGRPGQYIIVEISDYEMQVLERNQLDYTVIIDDMAEFYRKRNEKGSNLKITSGCDATSSMYQTPEHFQLGSFAGYYSYDELMLELDTMAALYPNLITVKQPVSTSIQTIESRDIMFVKISDNPNIDENEPELLYNSLHHSREPASMQQLVFFMYYLLENYDSNPEIQYLVDNTEFYFVPCVNPDGYIHNELNDPNGGGMWRKNKRDNGDGSFGVDLNRNYGYEWGFDNTGSSSDTQYDSYRGTAGFSEPETQIMKEFCESRDFLFAISYHTYSDLLIYPWGYMVDHFTPDNDAFMAFSKWMTSENNYLYGTANQTVGYTGNGTSDDWMYGEQSTKDKIFAFSPEAGNANDGFWPEISRIEDICKVNVCMNMYMARFAHKYAKVQDLSPAFWENSQGYFHYDIQCLGIDTPATFTVSLEGINGELLPGNLKTYSNMQHLEVIADSLEYEIDPSVLYGSVLDIIVKVDNGEFVFTDTLHKPYGPVQVPVYEPGNDMQNWTSTSWGISTTEYYSASGSFTDSPSGNYSMFSSNSISLDQTVDLSNAQFAQLSFYAKWDISAGYDFAQLHASIDGGSTWIPVCGKYTKIGGDGEPIYEGTQDNWVKEEIDLVDFIGETVQFKFTMDCSFIFTADGFYFDEFKIETIDDSVVGKDCRDISNSDVVLYPNPAVNKVIIDYQGSYDIQIDDVSGKTLYKGSHIKRSSIDVDNWREGIYFVRIKTENNKEYNKKLLIIR
ncbi:MAG: hypothetical protein C0594_04250, partial [Marinilabiliales bacterium]